MQDMIERALSEEQRMMRNTIRSFVDREVAPFVKRNWEKEWDMKPENRPTGRLLEGAHGIGIRALGVPEEFGGTPIDPATEIQTFAMVAEEISRGDSGLCDKLTQIWKVSKLLAHIAPRHLQEKWFPRIAAEPHFLLAHCATEPRGASDRWLPYDVPEAMMHTKAVLQGDRWVLNGRKQFITNGYDASLFVVYATTKPGAGISKGTSSFLVPRETPGLTVQRCNETLGGRFSNSGEIVFEDCAVPKDHCLAQDDAMHRAAVYFRPGKIIVAAKNLGVGMAAFEATAQYVQNYVQGGKIIIKHQAVASRLADMATRLVSARTVLNEAVRALESRSPEADVLCNMAKLHASTEVFEVAKNAMELHGGNGVMLDFGVEKYLRDAAVFLHRDATVDICRFRIVKAMFPRTAGIYAGGD
ncbi:MAG: acyl-CoA/acyl-ACP dehydrogenase [Burkholderiales bacterium]|nr:acyl-CoA/acyl-ACP dehydrogenase [Burkholderiales bacterium]